jgi:hypothetical protein
MPCRVGFKHLHLLVLLALAACATPQLADFEATLAADPSATAALGQWCARQQIAKPARISAAPIASPATTTPPADIRHVLNLPADQAPGYRHVRLSCGHSILSEAHNWYVPARLTPAMNAVLASTDTPFGKVAAPLGFTRERLSSQHGRGPGCPAGTILTHRALLRLPAGQPLALVVECYTRANLRPR